MTCFLYAVGSVWLCASKEAQGNSALGRLAAIGKGDNLRWNGTYPPLKAPTGFRTGKGIASANRRGDVWKLRDMRREADGVEMRRIDGRRVRDAMAPLLTKVM